LLSFSSLLQHKIATIVPTAMLKINNMIAETNNHLPVLQVPSLVSPLSTVPPLSVDGVTGASPAPYPTGGASVGIVVST
jgi:hypothetical protein